MGATANLLVHSLNMASHSGNVMKTIFLNYHTYQLHALWYIYYTFKNESVTKKQSHLNESNIYM